VRGLIFATTSSLVLIACGGGGTQPGDACSAKQPCDNGQICDLTDTNGPACLDGSGDVDGDGIPNDKDFCEHMAGGAFDEDGDGIGDDCDPCPIAKPPATPETDGDGVDSPCDPNPKMPGDKIVLFNGFNGPLPATWKASAAWQIKGGEAVMTPTAAGSVEQLSSGLTTPSNHLSIFASYRIDSLAPGATDADAGVFGITRLLQGDLTIECSGSRSGLMDQLELTTDATQASNPQNNLFDSASLYRVLAQLDGGTANCALIADKENGAISGSASGNAMSEVGLSVRGATARFAYILAVTR
jgi:hypothetical protein